MDKKIGWSKNVHPKCPICEDELERVSEGRYVCNNESCSVILVKGNILSRNFIINDVKFDPILVNKNGI